jgi:hypothetical protein
MHVKDNDSGVPTYWGQSGRALQMLISAVAVTDFLLFGYDQGYVRSVYELNVWQTLTSTLLLV